MRAVRLLLPAALLAVPAAWSPAAARLESDPAFSGPRSVGVMLIGDSLSVGPFGQTMERFLRDRYGSTQVCVFASCGSSPEHWLADAPVFTTTCGYRQWAPGPPWRGGFTAGDRPGSVRTPKLKPILDHYVPDYVIVQLGTNWMDGLAADGTRDGSKQKKIIRKFIRELRSGVRPPFGILWILPPSSSKYPPQVHDAVDRWITETAQSMRFGVMDSRRITGPYTRSSGGRDGVHYSEAAGERWAKGVIRRIFRTQAATD